MKSPHAQLSWLALAVAMLASTTLAHGPHESLFLASTVEEVKIAEEGHDFRKEPNTTEKDNNRHTRGRRIQEDGTLETSEHVLSDRFDNVPGFYHSVASGDPLSDSVIVWTRYTPNSKDEEIDLELRIEEATSTSNDTSPPRSVNFDNVNPTLLDPDLNSNLFRIKVTVTAANDFVAKIDLKGLKSNTWYVFAFSDGTQASDVGLTRTAPAENEVIESFQYAVFSCTHFTNGFFHSYDAASTIKDLDLWIHVGDYYYEYGLYSNYARDASEQRDPFLLPEWETIDLQDYRNRHASYVGFDEALRFLRRRAPMMATWDDHELTDNSWGNDSGAGAENHQATCPVGPNATKEEKVAAACDRDEGDAVERFSNALQAYLEWMPIRTAPGDMGALTGAGSITQVVEWGDLATIVSFDTRTSYRTEEPSGFRFGTFSEFAEQYPDYEKYTEEGSEEYIALNEFAQEQRAIQYREDAVMAAPYINNVLKPAFDASKQAGKPWQIWAANSLMGPYVLPPADQFFLDVPSLIQPVVKAAIDGLLSQNQSLALRAEIALAAVNMEWNADDYCGFAAERADVLKLAQDQDYNMIVLGGDLHDAFAWQMYEGGNRTGIPVAVNLACPGVTSPGLAQTFNPILASVGGALGGTDAFFNMLHGAYKRENPGLKLVDLRYAGFYVVTATKETHTAEYFGFPAETTLSNYADARASSEAITAEALCVGAVVTRASEPGSLDTVDGCTNTEFTKTRSKVFQMFVPNGTMTEGTTLSNCGAAGCTVSDTTASVPPGSPTTPIGPPRAQPTPSPIYSAGVSLSPVFGFVTLATVAIFALSV